MPLTPADIEALNLIFNEATLLGVEIDVERSVAAITFLPLALPVPGSGANANDVRIQVTLRPVGRVLGSLRAGWWNDKRAPVLPLSLGDVLPTVEATRQAVYGELFDVPLSREKHWMKRTSFEHVAEHGPGLEHHVALFQNPGETHLDILIWFDELVLRRADGNELSIDECEAATRAWWDALRQRDPRTADKGIMVLAPNQFGLRGWWRRLTHQS